MTGEDGAQTDCPAVRFGSEWTEIVPLTADEYVSAMLSTVATGDRS